MIARLNSPPDKSSGAEQLQAWRRTIDRAILHPGWPMPFELYARRDSRRSESICLCCVLHTYEAEQAFDASDDQPLHGTDFLFTAPAPEIEGDEARLDHLLAYVRRCMLHELDEFLLVDGRVARSPHEPLDSAGEEGTSASVAEIAPRGRADAPSEAEVSVSEWRSAVDRVSLHRAWRLRLRLDVARFPPYGATTILCALNPLDAASDSSSCSSAKSRSTHHAIPPDDESVGERDRIQHVLVVVRGAVLDLLDECLSVDGRPLPDHPQASRPHGLLRERSKESAMPPKEATGDR